MDKSPVKAVFEAGKKAIKNISSKNLSPSAVSTLLKTGTSVYDFFAGSKSDTESRQNQREDLRQKELDWEYQRSSSDLQKEAAKSNYQAQIRNLKLARIRDIEKTAKAKSIFDAISAAQQEMMQLQAHQMQQDLASNILTSGVMMSESSNDLVRGQNLMSEKQARLAQLKHLSNEPERQTDDAMITNNISVLEGQINAIEGQKDLDASFENSRKNYFGDLRSRLGRAATGGKIKRGVGLANNAFNIGVDYFLDSDNPKAKKAEGFIKNVMDKMK